MSPIKYKDYADNWKTEIRPFILKRAVNCCEICGVKNGEYGYRDKAGKFYPWIEIENALENNGYEYFDHELAHHIDKNGQGKKGITIVLTIAHIDHDKNNNDYENLKALCQRCHLHLDKEQHLTNVRATRNKKKGQTELELT